MADESVRRLQRTREAVYECCCTDPRRWLSSTFQLALDRHQQTTANSFFLNSEVHTKTYRSPILSINLEDLLKELFVVHAQLETRVDVLDAK